MRASTSYQAWKEKPFTERKLGVARQTHANALFAVLKSHGHGVSHLAIMLEVNERQSRKYLDASAPIPTTILDALPFGLAEEFVQAIAPNGTSSAAEMLRRAIGRLEREGAPENLLSEAFARLGALSARQRGGR